jgi:Flp pilus assembly secretin CpaC
VTDNQQLTSNSSRPTASSLRLTPCSPRLGVIRKLLAVSAFVLLATVVSRAAGASEDLTIAVGEQKILSVPAGSDIGFTGPLHIVQLDAERIEIIGDGPGWGSITVKSGTQVFQYSVEVVSVPPEQTIAKLKSLLGKLNLTYTAAGSQVIVEGRIETTQDLERFNKVMETFPEVVNMVVITAKEAMIDIAVTLVEVDATSSSDLGLLNIVPPSGTASLSGTIPLVGVTGGTSGTNIQVSLAASSQLLNALNAQIESGRAKIIASPRIVTLNRREAVITSGGEIPYRVVSSTGGVGVDYKPYGITLKVTPEARMNDVLLQLSMESTEPVGTVSSTSENPLTSSSVDLNVAVEKDKTLALAGLYNAVTSSQTQGGFLFPLFAASSSTRKRELIILVTPRVSPDGIGQDYFKMVKPEDMKR